MKISFDTKTIEVKSSTPSETVSVSEVDLISITDNATDKKIVALVEINGVQKAITLWEDDAYDAIGDWTQQQANEKIISLL